MNFGIAGGALKSGRPSALIVVRSCLGILEKCC